jgi:SPP1 gp7 family putative phage head morphogenesis protein
MTKPPLTKAKKKWAENRNVTLQGKPLNYNASQQAKYKSALEKLVRQMTDETKRQIIKLFEGDTAEEYFEQQEQAEAMDASIASKARKLMNKLTSKFTQLFNSKALPLADTMVDGAAKTSQSNLHSSLMQLSGGVSLKTSLVPQGMEDVAKASVQENVSLIKSIPQQYFKDVTGAVMRSITYGQGLADLVPHIQKYNAQTYRRAKNLALDQTRKAYNSINKQRMQALGVKQFKWIHSNAGQHPRESHLKISGTVFDFDTLEQEQAALGVPPEDRGIPGQPINCKCTMSPVIEVGNGQTV